MTFMFTKAGPLRRQGRRRWRNAGVAGDAALFWRTPGGRHGTAWLGGAATYETYHFGVFFLTCHILSPPGVYIHTFI